ncbi:MAG: OmpA family protein [Spirosomataceae bacterium]
MRNRFSSSVIRYLFVLIKGRLLRFTPTLKQLGGKKALLPYFLLLVSCVLPWVGQAQNLSSTNKKAVELYQKATEAFQQRKVEEAFNFYEKAVEKDPAFAEAWMRLGSLYELTRQYDKALELYKKSIDLNPDLPALASAYQFTGNYYLRHGKYQQALQYYEKQFSLTPSNSFVSKRVSRNVETCRFALSAMNKPYVLNVRPLKEINIFPSQYFPVLTADRETLIFTATEKINENENLFVSHLENGVWTSPTSLSAVINTPENEGTCSISADGRTLVFTSCQGRKGFGNCDLFITHKTGNDWSEPQNLGREINSPAWESQPALSPDGKTLYFVSDKMGGLGKRDIWVSRQDSLGDWSKAINLGNTINTPDDDLSPFMHANGKTLFFSSEGHLGLGGLDVFFSELTTTGWSKPQNLGYPINTHEDQVALFITADGKKGYYSLEETQEIGKRNAKLYEFDMPTELIRQFKKANYLKGSVFDVVTKKPVGAEIELFNLKTNQLETKIPSDSQTGNYTTILNDGGEYAVYVNKSGYFFKSLSFDYSGDNAGDKILDIYLEPLVKDRKEVLNNVYFETGKYSLEEKSKIELVKLLTLLKQNPTLKVEISGHTDDIGKDTENLLLSRKRAQAVGEYLVQQGVKPEQIKTEGYGKTRPLMPNTSEENRKVNRRIEVKML